MRPDHPILLHKSAACARPPSAPAPGYWCEWRHADGSRIRSAAQSTPASAVRWARINIRIIASAMGEMLADHLVDRRAPGWANAVSALERDGDFTLPLVAGPFSFVWHARPAVFLPVVGGFPMPHLVEGSPRWD